MQNDIMNHSVNLVQFLSCTVALNFHKLSPPHHKHDNSVSKELFFH